MKKGETRFSRGFTIVEVALVLAVAGLIFVMVFLAVPALRASERDTERREDIAFLLDSIKKYQTNNRGALPDVKVANEWNDFRTNYLGGANFFDPDGTEYILAPDECQGNTGDRCTNKGNGNIETMDHTLHILISAKCDGPDAKKSSNPRKVAVRYRLEGSGIFCQST